MVLGDLYLGGETAPRALLPEEVRLPALEYVVRFGARRALPTGWRPWLARWLGCESVAPLAPARIAALTPAATRLPPPGTAWFATPVQLQAGLSRVHLAHAGVLRLGAGEQAELARAFARDFAGSGYALQPVCGGELILRTPTPWSVTSCEPARSAGGELPAVLAQGAEAAVLRRLMAEMEMWLHSLPMNAARRGAGEAPVTTLWLWGGEGDPASPAPAPPPALPRAWGDDAYLSGMWHLLGGSAQPLPQAGRVPAAAGERGVIVLKLSAQPAAATAAGGASALAHLDAQWLEPAVHALGRGLQRLSLIANDWHFSVSRTDAWRFWRARRPGLSGLV